MQIPQMIYGSSDRGDARGYQLLGQSRGINDRLTGQFSRWAPSHGALQCSDAESCSVNFTSVQGDKFIVSRTIHGGPEYSGRGGLQVVTIGLVFEAEQLALYGNHPLDVVHTAVALGQMIFPRSIRKLLHPATLPRRPFPRRAAGRLSDREIKLVDEARHLLEARDKVVVIGSKDPVAFVDRLFDHLGDADPILFNFSTGLKPSNSREVSLQFLASADHVAIRQLDQRRYVCLEVEEAAAIS